MGVEDREDIVQLNALADRFELEQIEFKPLMQTMVGFVRSDLLSGGAAARAGIDAGSVSLASQLMDAAENLLAEKLSPEQAEDYRVQAWDAFDQRDDADLGKGLFRVVVCCLYDREAAEFDSYGASAVLETFLSSLLDMGPAFCRQFGAYALQHLRV